MGEPAKFMIAAMAAVEGDCDEINDRNERVCLAIRFSNDDQYETIEPMIRSMCRQIRSRRPGWAELKPRQIEQMLNWMIFSTTPASNGWPYFLTYWQRDHN